MAIERMKRLTIVCEADAAQRLAKNLHEMGVVELTDAEQQCGDVSDRLRRILVSTDDCDRELQKIGLILGLLDTFAPEQKSFVAGLATVPLVIDPKELDEAIHKFNLDEYYDLALKLDDIHRRAERAIGDILNRRKDLFPIEGLPFALDDFHKPKRVRLIFGTIPVRGLESLATHDKAGSLLAWQRVISAQDASQNDRRKGMRQNETGWIVAAFLREDEADARRVLLENQFSEITLPAFRGTVRDHLRELNEDLGIERGQIDEVARQVRGFAHTRRTLTILKAFWDGRRRFALARSNTLSGAWVHVVTGYVREKDLTRLHALISKEFPSASVLLEDPATDADVPVSIALPNWMKPIQMLINLFGLPRYNTFDPSPNIFFTFLMFFGICFSDVAYGAMLVLVSLYIMKKTRQYEGVYNFARLLLYGGVSSVLFGFLLGSWFGDLYKPEYLGENNLVANIMTQTQVLDPIENPILVLLIALAIGMLNQLYAIALKMYGALKRGDSATAFYDALLWIVILPGFAIVVAKLFTPVPAAIFTAGLTLFIVGAIGLVLTQGRASKSLLGRFLTGLVSLYGIVGSYGLTAFIGDTMSYCRLLALALTTSIVALSFNMMAGLLRPIPGAGIGLFILMLIAAHIFNFAISVLGAFVHSMRLIFVEFFGRFYSSGARPFAPLGFDSRAAVLKKAGG